MRDGRIKMRTIKKLEAEKEKIKEKVKLLESLDKTPQISLEITTMKSAINVINVKILTLNEVLKMMNNMQFIGAGEIEKQLRENITGEPRHRGYSSAS